MKHLMQPQLKSRSIRLARVIAVAFAMGTATAIAGPAGAASAWNIHEATGADRQIRFPQAARCIPIRRIFLAAGRYRWRLYIAHGSHPGQPTQHDREIRLTRGWYRWSDCFSFPGGHVPLRQRSMLVSERTGGRLEHPNNPVYGRFGNGTYYWGSTLSRRT